MAVSSDLKNIMTAYKALSFSDRAAFYSTVSNDICVTGEHLQSFLIETRIRRDQGCIYCGSTHVVKNGTRKDGTQRFLCRACRRSFLPTSNSVTSRTRKRLSVWASYINCMLDKKTLRETAEECQISMTTAFLWRHKILDGLHEMAENIYLDGVVEADETFFNVSYKGNHRHFAMPRVPHKRGGSVHAKGLSFEKVCVPCAVSDAGLSYARPAKLGKVSSECISETFDGIISPHATLCTDNEKAYRAFARDNKNRLIQMDTDCRTRELSGETYGIQRVNACHSSMKGFLHRFRGVSTKYLENYLVWNGLLANSRRSREELFSLLLAQILTVPITIRNRDVSQRPPLPGMAAFNIA